MRSDHNFHRLVLDYDFRDVLGQEAPLRLDVEQVPFRQGLGGAGFHDAMFTAEGTLLANAIVLLDGKNILYANGLDTEIAPESSAHILLTMTAIGGG